MATRRTRASNTGKHPGQIVTDQKQKRRTKEEIALDNQAAQAKKTAKTLEREDNCNEVAMVEHRIEEEDANDPTIAPRHKQPLRRAQRYTEFYAANDDTEARSDTTVKADGNRDGQKDSGNGDELDIEDKRPKKKSKVSKPNAQETITASRKAMALARTDTEEMMDVDKSKHDVNRLRKVAPQASDGKPAPKGNVAGKTGDSKSAG